MSLKGIGPKIYTKLANSKVANSVVEWAGKEYTAKNGTKRTNFYLAQKCIPAIIPVWAGTFNAVNIVKSKDIPAERKQPLILNTYINDAIGITTGFLFNGKVEKFMEDHKEKFAQSLEKYHYDATKKARILNGFSMAIPILTFAFTLKFLAPIIATPLAGKTDDFLIKHHILPDPTKSKSKS